MALLFFHCGDALGVLVGMAFSCVCWIAILTLLSTRPPRDPIIPAILYLLIASIPCTLLLMSDDLSMLQVIVVWIFGFPWLVVFVVLEPSFDLNFGNSVALIGAFLNAILFYVVGKTARWRLDRRSRTIPADDA